MDALFGGGGESEFDQFVAEMPRTALTVCGKEYHCRAKGTQHVWSTYEQDGAPSRECNVDLLVAAAHANNCRAPRATTSAHCDVHNPFLTDGTTTVQVREEETTGIPSIVEAGWKCVAPVSGKTHDPTHVEKMGGALALLHLEVAPQQERGERDVPQEERNERDVPQEERNERGVPQEERNERGVPQEARSGSARAPREAQRASEWRFCTLPMRAQPRACAVDADCPIPDGQLKELLLAKTREMGVDMGRGLHKTLDALKRKLSDDLAWTDDRVKALEGRSRTEASVKTSIGTLVETDSVFRAAVRHVVETDADFTDLRAQRRVGSCEAQGRCATAQATPTARLYDGTAPVSFTRMDGKVLYTRHGVTREAHAERCTGAAAKQCDLAADSVGEGEQVRAVAAAYVLRTDAGDDYLVHNHVKTRGDERDCAALLCEHNARSGCPASVCRVDAATHRCVPKQ